MLFARKQPVISRDDALAARPRRLVEQELNLKDDGGAALRVPLQPTRLSRWFFRVPSGTSKTFEFDSIGVFVWKMCDGKNSVQQIIRKLSREYHLNLRAAEIPTIRFLHTLAKKGLIGMKLEKRN